MRKLLISYAFLFALGFAGAHRFYLGRFYTGVLYLCTAGFLGIGVIIDFFMIPFMIADDIDSEGGDVMEFLLRLFLGTAVFTAFCFMVSFMLWGLITVF